ncbi:hypothetical protein [Streptomyces sp. NRRL S-1824]|uniref:hypothetical protein n=1 Tax=Streptomyces sp. NRRL S-1824 TaxID=1463889 RepID=UPI0004C563F7|nr:hypothetical protein [Streptomyces sp. NRRL S-1824]
MGRPLGALKGRTEQANEFARWLRKVTAGVTVRTLETDFPYGKSSWSGFRDGSRLPSPELVGQVAAQYLREPVMRTRQLDHGLRLLEAAQKAARVLEGEQQDLSVSLPGPRRGDNPTTAALLRLDDARLRQIEAMQKLAASERQRERLEDMVSVLEERCTLLESERDRAREDAQAELQSELQMSLEYRRQADEKLEHARRAEEKAYELRLAAEKQVTIERLVLRQIDQDTAQDTVRPPVSGLSMAQELNLPPLEQIHELLEVAQKQLDVQDDELDDLGEQIGLGAKQVAGDDPRTPTRIVQGHVVDSSETADLQDVSEHRQDNAGKPVTSEEGILTSHTNDDAYLDNRTRNALPQNVSRSESMELVTGLETVSTPAALSTALTQLLQRTGLRSITNLTLAAFPGKLKDDLLLMAVMRWIDGEALPDSWPHLESLVRVMGATDREVEAFRQAYTRITSSDLSAIELFHDLADLTPTARGPLDISRWPSSLPDRKRDWMIAFLGPCTIATLTTGYTAGLQAVPGPGLGKLVGYGALALLVCVFVLMAVVSLTTPSIRGEKRSRNMRPADIGLALGATLLALPTGLAIPWILDSDTAGRWLADLVGLV